MNNQMARGNNICFDLKEKCISISKNVLHFIGNPKYIQFLINRRTKVMFIWGHDTKVECSVAINPRVYTDPKYSYRMKKSAFVEAIGAFCGWDSQGKYQLYGTSYTNRVIRFSLRV